MKKSMCAVIAVLVFAAIGCAGKKRDVTAAKRDAARTAVWNDETREECLRAIKKARVDARNGSYRMYVFAQDGYDAGFAPFLMEYMKTRHGIDLVLSGSDDRRRSKCYSNEMDKIILNTFGPGVLADAEQAARELLKSRK